MLFLGHGLTKLMHFQEMKTQFPDPLGVGPVVSLTITVICEVVLAFFVALGAATRVAAAFVFLMLVIAAFVVHAADPWSKKEFAVIYAIPFLVITLTGPGRLSLDSVFGWFKKR